MQPLLSILIATKNRVPYCIRSLETILGINDERIELVVQDNSDSLELRDYIKKRQSDTRLRYNYTPPPFSSIDNFNAAIDLSTGKYVCLIGDDDGICRQIMDLVEWADQNYIESICPAVYSEYVWPSTFGDDRDAVLKVPETTGDAGLKDPAAILMDYFRNGAVDYLKKGLPKLYHGIIKRSCLEKVKSKTGHYLGGLSPDIYAAVSLSCVVKSHLLVDLPLTVAGTCSASTTYASATGSHSGELRKAPHFRDRETYRWEPLVPEVYSVETIWAESALKAAVEMRRADLIYAFADSEFMARNILRNTHKFGYFTKQTLLHLKKNRKLHQAPAVAVRIAWHLLRFSADSAIRKIRKENIKNPLIYTNVMDIGEASAFATENLEGKQIIPFLK